MTHNPLPDTLALMARTRQSGIHIGVMAGTLDLVQRSYLGEAIRNGVLSFAPKPISQLRDFTFPMCFGGLLLKVALDEHNRLQVTASTDSLNPNHPAMVGAGDQVQEIRPGQMHCFDVSTGVALPKKRAV